MEIYHAISDFSPPNTEGSQNILSFEKGDKFEIFDCHKQTDWWGARSLKDNSIGYVPCKYLQHEERKIGKLLPACENISEHREKALRHFADMQNSVNHRHPEDLYLDVPEPAPDYQNDDNEEPTTDSFPPPPPPITSESVIANGQGPQLLTSGQTSGDEGLIQPKKLANPCLESRERQALHKELLLNYKIGKDVLKKPELNKILQKRKESQRIKEWDEQKKLSNKRTSLEMKLEERASKMKEEEEKTMKTISEDGAECTPEYLKVHAKILHKSSN